MGDYLVINKTIGGSVGSSSAAPLAPAIVGSWVTITPQYAPYGNAWKVGFSGTVTPPVGTDCTHLMSVFLEAKNSAGFTWQQTVSGPFTAGTPISFKFNTDDLLSSTAMYTVNFVSVNEDNVHTTPAYSAIVTATLGTISSITVAEVTGARRADERGGILTDLGVTLNLTGVAVSEQQVTLWLDRNEGDGPDWINWYPYSSTNNTFTLWDVYVSTVVGTPTWTIYAALGAIDETTDITTVSTVAYSFSAPAVGAVADTSVTGAQFVPNGIGSLINYSSPSGTGHYYWLPNELDFTQPSTSTDPNYWYSFITVQKVDSSGNPAPDDEGKDEQPLLYKGRWIIDSGVIQGHDSIPGSTVQWLPGDPVWTFPMATNPDGSTNVYRTFRFRLYAVSRLGTDKNGGTGTFTLQKCWAGGADHFDLTPVVQPSALDLSQAAPHSLGDGLDVTGTKMHTKVSSGVTHDAFGNIVVNNGIGLTVDGSGFLRVNSGQGLTADGTGIYIANSGLSNQFFASLSIATINLQNSAVTGTKIANASINTAHINNAQITTVLIANGAITNALIGNLAVGTSNIQDLAVTSAKISSLSADKITAGTISASVSLTSPTLTITNSTVTVNIDGVNFVKITNTGTSRWTEHTWSHFRVEKLGDSLNFAQIDLARFSAQDPFGANYCTVAPTLLQVSGLPSSNPGAGSKQFWYDPFDSNRVKFQP